MNKYLDNINSPSDVRKLSREECVDLCDEIRDFLIKSSERRGGHLASNLGAVELTVALHRVFDSPKDRIIFDVGHQAYVHKLLTGRREAFDTLRVPGGLSGFTSRRESRHDPFGAGHSSTSLSAALGFAEADMLDGSERCTVCVIGDGAYTGGMIHEALNNCRSDLPVIIVLNENGMSISTVRGTFASYLSRVRTSEKYRNLKAASKRTLSKMPLGSQIIRLLSFSKEKIKAIIYRKNYFEQLGLYYIGPIDGHDLEKCERAFAEARSLGGATVVHLKTVKGKGHTHAEKYPDEYHSVGAKADTDNFHSVFADELVRIAQDNDNIVAVTAAMGMGTGLSAFEAQFPKRYFDVGIAEPHAMTFAAGLAAAGKIPFVGIYSTFLQRAYDSIVHDIALQGLPVKIMIDRAGLAVGDGATHHGIFDVAFLSHIPGMVLLAPINYASLTRAISFAVDTHAAVAIRYPNAPECADFDTRFKHIGNGVSIDFDKDDVPDIVFVSYGKICDNVIRASEIVKARGVRCGIAVMEILAPIDDPVKTLISLLSRARRAVIVEEGIRRGGVGEAICARLCESRVGVDCTVLAINDSFASPDTPVDLYEYVGLDAVSIAKSALGGGV